MDKDTVSLPGIMVMLGHASYELSCHFDGKAPKELDQLINTYLLIVGAHEGINKYLEEESDE